MRGKIESVTPKVIPALMIMVFTSGCAGVNTPTQPYPVPEIHPGLLQGYLSKENLPNSLSLLPPEPAKGTAADKLDQKISQSSLSLRGTPRWELAKQDANLHFPDAAETFSCALNAPITEQDTPHLYMLLRLSGDSIPNQDLSLGCSSTRLNILSPKYQTASWRIAL